MRVAFCDHGNVCFISLAEHCLLGCASMEKGAKPQTIHRYNKKLYAGCLHSFVLPIPCKSQLITHHEPTPSHHHSSPCALHATIEHSPERCLLHSDSGNTRFQGCVPQVVLLSLAKHLKREQYPPFGYAGFGEVLGGSTARRGDTPCTVWRQAGAHHAMEDTTEGLH